MPVAPSFDLDRFFAPHRPPGTTLACQLQYWAQQQPLQVAFYYLDEQDRELSITYEELDRQSRAIAARLTSLNMRGQRALLFFPPGLDFVSAFFGCLYAGTVAVPAYPPRRNRNMARVETISDDAQASIVLTVREVADRSLSLIDDTPHLRQLAWLATDELVADPEYGASSPAADWQPTDLDPEAIAVLQYTSGSTGTPKGVMLTHANVMHNCELITYGFEPSRSGIGLTWLPTFHDMGLVGGVLKPLFYGRPNVLMSPMAFLQKPVRWLQGISRYRVTISGGPNFAYALCTEKIGAAQCEGLDLSSWDVAFNGAEPIRAETLRAFTEKFGPYGFRAETHYPCYGMAETTLIVTGSVKQERPVVRSFDAAALEQRQVVVHRNGNGAGTTRQLVSCGRVLPSQEIVIVDPSTREKLAPSQVGEIWVRSRSVAQGYWNRSEDTERTFRAQLADGTGGPFLRTGDLGFLHEGELFVAGRQKDLIIVRGRNLYPHDIEQSVSQAHPALVYGGGAAFSIESADEEQLVIAHELERQSRHADLQEVVAAISENVLREHEVSPAIILLLRAGQLPKTSSGKVQRHACREEFLSGSLRPLIQWTRHTPGDTPCPSPPPSRPNGKPHLESAVRDLQSWLMTRIAGHLKVPVTQVPPDASFAQLGLDSLALIGFSGELEQRVGRRLSPSLLYHYPTIATLAVHLAEPEELSALDAAGLHPVSKPRCDHAGPVAAERMSRQQPSAAEALANLDKMSDAEVEAMLKELQR